MTPDLEQALFDSVGVLNSLGLRYAVVGGLAVSAWALPRATRDVDLYAELPIGLRAAVERELEARGFRVPAMNHELEVFGVFRARATNTGTFLDVFDAAGPLGEAILDRRRRIMLGTEEVCFVSPEDLALLKAFSERERDFEDLVSLHRHAGALLDREYIDRWVGALDESIGGDEVSERVARARALARRGR